MDASDLNFCHNLKGKHICYVLRCESDEHGHEMVYVGSTTNIERRIAQHLGLLEGGAAFCKQYKPISVIEVRLCNNAEEMAIMENILVSIHQARCGYQAARGSRYNMPGPMKRPPIHFSACPEFVSPRSDASTEAPFEIPTDLPPMYQKLKEENGIEEAQPPKPCLCFVNNKDPDGTYRQHASLLPA